ncbi:uncharacterized protein BXZ73DRAFT_76826 [Epithele typhae]|uniref:uncharacterized protein n=1 Tax=Epithele typhae TaxID=378194 RepID=UPI0020083247|nr:uncharacterized protein BXZ73DRAFT_76826 [Epithele typhae]KAH9935115.1 hypothetical protein BXZ73DRAFT_76826 [Epithele typhae]
MNHASVPQDLEKAPLALAPGGQHTPPRYQAVAEGVYYQPPFVQDHPRNVRRRRFWHFLACSILAMTAFHLFIHPHHFKHLFGESDLVPQAHARPSGGQIAEPRDCYEYASWTETHPHENLHYPYHATTSFELPIDAAELLFTSSGPYHSGVLDVTQSSDVPADKAIVEVDVHYYLPEVFEDATTPDPPPHRNPHREWQLNFAVRVRLPEGSTDSPLKVNTLKTLMHNFALHLHELASTVYFDNVDLSTHNGPITLDRSLVSDRQRLVVLVLERPDPRDLSALSSLNVHTSNGPIIVHGKVFNGGDDAPTTNISLSTSNGQIDGGLSLLSNASSGTGGAFSVNARTSNGPLALTVHEMPVDARLGAIAHTSNSRARASLPPAFEGTFALRSSAFSRPVVRQTDVEDPAGRGRRRVLHQTVARRGETKGTVVWEGNAEEKGSFVLETSNGPVELTL